VANPLTLIDQRAEEGWVIAAMGIPVPVQGREAGRR
jgi:hypothetical protein